MNLETLLKVGSVVLGCGGILVATGAAVERFRTLNARVKCLEDDRDLHHDQLTKFSGEVNGLRESMQGLRESMEKLTSALREHARHNTREVIL